MRAVVEGLILQILSDENEQVRTRALNTHPEAKALVKAIGSNLELESRRKLIREKIVTDNHIEAVVADLELVPVRLIGTKNELYSAHDRLMTEGDFRAAISVPCLALGVAVALTVSGTRPLTKAIVIMAGLLLAVALGLEARNRVVAAFDQLAEAIRANDGRDSPITRSVSNASIQFKSTALDREELARLQEKAEEAETQGQPQRAIEWYSILADAGVVDAHEKLCDITRSVNSQYFDSYRIVEPVLIAGSAHSGRLALEALESILLRGSEDEWADRRQPIGTILLNLLTIADHEVLAFHMLARVYRTEDLDEPDSGELLEAMRLVHTRSSTPIEFLIDHTLPDVSRERMRKLYADTRNGHDYAEPPAWLPT